MEIFAGLSVGLLVLTALAVAIKTLRMWLRTRGLPELMLGVMLVASTVIGYPLAIVSSQIPATELSALHIASQSVFCIGYAGLLLFTMHVFRPEALWAKALSGVTMLVLVGATFAFAEGITGDSPKKPGELAGVTVLISSAVGTAYLWTMTESFLYYRQLRLRLRLGLTEAVVANRVLLWGLMALSAGVAVVINAVATVLGHYMAPPVVLVSSALGLVHAGSLLFAFHPPAWYLAWVEGRGAATQSVPA